MQKLSLIFVLFFSLLTINYTLLAQITSPSSSDSRVSDIGDDCFIFCVEADGDANGSLVATPLSDGVSTYAWEKFDTLSFTFNDYPSTDPFISYLDDGLYRVTVSNGSMSTTDQAWVLNNWIEVTKTEIPDSSSLCDGFRIWADYDYAPLNVYNTNTGAPISVRNTSFDFGIAWYHGSDLVSSVLSPYISSPIASNSSVEYTLVIEDEFGCQGEGAVDYISKVPESDFSVDPMSGEAVLDVTFTNSSINYDSTIWSFYKDDYRISKTFENDDAVAEDSIDFVLYDDSPFYSYEYSGDYQVRLLTVKVNGTGNCYNTLYMGAGTYIEVDTTLIQVPNVFTPNGDGINDVFVVKSQSLKSLTVKIYNRWGGLVHSWKYSNITSNDYTYEHSVWDGKIGGRYATPGVYFYVIRYEGRDGEKRYSSGSKKKTLNGFVHLFRNKD